MRFLLWFVSLVLSSSLALAQPATGALQVGNLDELLTDKGKFKFDAGFVFSSRSQERADAIFSSIQTSPGVFVNIPVGISTNKRDTDIGILMFGARYGLTKDTELYLKTSLSSTNIRNTDLLGAVTNENNFQFNDLNLSINHKFIKPGENPGLIGFADINLAENTSSRGSKFVSGRSLGLGFTAFQIYDPLVVSLTAGYKSLLERETEGIKVNPGDILYINPKISFLVNPKITLSSGVTIKSVNADILNGITIGHRTTKADLEFGFGYVWSKTVSINTEFRTSVLGNEGISLGVNTNFKLP